jgi:hypothetical protein
MANGKNKRKAQQVRQPQRSGLNRQRVVRGAATDVQSKDLTTYTNRVKGSERFNVPVKYDTYVQQWDLAITDFTGSRLSIFRDLYEMYFVHSLTFEFVPSLSKTAPGSIFLCPEYDPEEQPPPLSYAWTVMASSPDAVSGSLSDPLTMTMVNRRLPCGSYVRPSMFIAPLGPARLCNFGKLYSLVVGCTEDTQSTVGYIVMKYDITFSCPSHDYYNWRKSTASTAKFSILGGNATNYCGSESIDTDTSYLQLQSSASAEVLSGCNVIVQGILSSLGGTSVVADLSGNVIAQGAKLFFRLAKQHLSAAGVLTPYSSTGNVAEINLFPDFPPKGRLRVSGTHNDDIGLHDTSYWSRSGT